MLTISKSTKSHKGEKNATTYGEKPGPTPPRPQHRRRQSIPPKRSLRKWRNPCLLGQMYIGMNGEESEKELEITKGDYRKNCWSPVDSWLFFTPSFTELKYIECCWCGCKWYA